MSNSAARLIARHLYNAGCRHAFGIPGGEVLSLLDALEAEGIAFHLCRHENAGGFMAEGSYHATGAPGILLGTVGPGVLNGLNAVANALQEQVPLIVLSGCVDGAEAATYTHQILDQNAALAPITKASLTAADGAVDVIIDKAIAIAMADPPGPVHLDLPITLADAEQTSRSNLYVPPAAPMAPADGPQLEAARKRIAQAERPLMIAGVGAVHNDASETITGICREHSIPLITTYKAKGVMPEDDPLCLGGHGLSPESDRILAELIEKSDLILLAGYDPIEMRVGWRGLWEAGKAIEVTHTPNRHGMHSASVSFIGDVGAGLARLFDGIAPTGSWPDGLPQSTRAALQDFFREPEAWGAHQVFATARRVLPKNTVVTADSGAHRILLSQMWTCYQPRTLLQSSALCTMGVALPLALGHKRADRDTPVMAVMGDAGFEMVLGELATLRDQKLPVIIMVMVDRSLSLIDLKQERMGLANRGVLFGQADYGKLAQAYGGYGKHVSSTTELEEELTKALDHETFTVLACDIDKRDYWGAF